MALLRVASRIEASATGSVPPPALDGGLVPLVLDAGGPKILFDPDSIQLKPPWAFKIVGRPTPRRDARDKVTGRQRYGMDVQATATNDGMVLRIPDTESEPPSAELIVCDPELIESVISDEVGSSALFAARFRENAARALLLPRRDPKSRSPLWQQRMRSAQLLTVAVQYPEFPIVQPVLEVALTTEIERSPRVIAGLIVSILSGSALLKNVSFLALWFLVIWLALRWNTQRRVNKLLSRWKSADHPDRSLNLTSEALEWMSGLIEPIRRHRERVESLATRADELRQPRDTSAAVSRS